MVIVYLRMWRAAKNIQKRDRLSMKWSSKLQPISTTVTSSTKNSTTTKVCCDDSLLLTTSSTLIDSQKINPLKKLYNFSTFLLTKKTLSPTEINAHTTGAKQSPLRRFQRPSSILNTVKIPSVKIYISTFLYIIRI